MPAKSDWWNLSLEEVQLFITDNNLSKKELYKNYQTLAKVILKNKWKDKIDFPVKTFKSQYFDTVEKLQIFIDENEFDTPRKFMKAYPSLYEISRKTGRLSKIVFKNRYGSKYNTIEEVQNLVDEENIQNPTDFRNRFKNIYQKVKRKKWTGDISYPNRKKSDYSWITKVEDIQKFIEDNKIQSPKDFEDRFAGLYMLVLTKHWNLEIKYPQTIFKSSWELKLEEFFIKNNIDIAIQYQSYSVRSKIDVYIPKYNVAIEIQGPNHFSKNCTGGYDSYLKTRKSDIKKNRWCKENGITLLYFSYDKSLVDKYGYPWYIYTSEGELLRDIQEKYSKVEK